MRVFITLLALSLFVTAAHAESGYAPEFTASPGVDELFVRQVIDEETPAVVEFCGLDKTKALQGKIAAAVERGNERRAAKLIRKAAKKADKCGRKAQQTRATFVNTECLNHKGPQVPGRRCLFGTKEGRRITIAADRDPAHVRAIYRHELCHRLGYGSEHEADRCEIGAGASE